MEPASNNTIEQTRDILLWAFRAVDCSPAIERETIAGVEYLRCEIFHDGTRRPVWFRRGAAIVAGGVGPLPLACNGAAVAVMARRHATWLAIVSGRGPRFCEVTGERLDRQPA